MNFPLYYGSFTGTKNTGCYIELTVRHVSFTFFLQEIRVAFSIVYVVKMHTSED